MCPGIPALIGGLVVLGAAGGLTYVARRKQLLAHAPSQMPPMASSASSRTLHQTPGYWFKKQMERTRAKFELLSPREQQLVFFSPAINERLARIMSELAASWYPKVKGHEAQQHRGQQFALVAARLLSIWPLLLSSSQPVDIARTWRDQLSAELDRVHRSRTGQPFDPTSPAPNNIGQALLTSAATDAAELVTPAQVARLTERSYAAAASDCALMSTYPPTQAKGRGYRSKVLENVARIMALCDWWAAFRWW